MLLWEIASFAVVVPYGEVETRDVIEAISSGRHIMLERYAYTAYGKFSRGKAFVIFAITCIANCECFPLEYFGCRIIQYHCQEQHSTSVVVRNYKHGRAPVSSSLIGG